MLVGIDYGSKLAGTTALAYLSDDKIEIRQSSKNQDADAFIIDTLKEIKAKSVYIDAPLSLPLAYYGKGEDYFYRKCDRALKAMSPMFLGGLTARAMKLADTLRADKMEVRECYPKAYVHKFENLKAVYQKKNKSTLADFLSELGKTFPLDIPDVTNWHQADALVAWEIGNNHQMGKGDEVGDVEEGVIFY
jgi:predicted nuclease with RNAse H fold